MSTWRLEWLRLVRTRRALILGVVYAFFGALGPITARYINDILKRSAGRITIIAPPPVPADGIQSFLSNAQQIGVLVVVLVSAGALAFDAKPESAVFLRSRAAKISEIVWPKVTVNAAAASVAFLIGVAIAWGGTAVLLGGLPVGGMLLGTALSLLYLIFVVAVVAFYAGLVRSTVGAAFASLGTLIGLGIIESLTGSAGRWVPSHLFVAMARLAANGGMRQYLPSAVVTVGLTGAALMGSLRFLSARDV